MKTCIFVVLLTVAYLIPAYAQDGLIEIQKEYDQKRKMYAALPYWSTNIREQTDFFLEKITYTPAARQAGVEGDMVIRFLVDSEGDVQDVEVVKSVHLSLDSLVTRVFEATPRWRPAVFNRAYTSCQISFLISFRLHHNKFASLWYGYMIGIGISSDPDSTTPFITEYESDQYHKRDKLQLIKQPSVTVRGRNHVKIHQKNGFRFKTSHSDTVRMATIANILSDGLILLVYKEDSIKRRKERFRPLKYIRVPYKELTEIHYLDEYSRRAFGSFLLFETGVIMTLETPLLLVIMDNTEAFRYPGTWITIGVGGIATYLGSRWMKKLKPTTYRIGSEWQLHAVLKNDSVGKTE